MGQELVNVLSEMVRDGLATEEGFRRLQQWLGERPDGQLPAMDFLSRVIGERASKPEFTTRDLFELQFAVERVLPHPLREQVAARRQSAWSRVRATENPVVSLHDLGGTPAAGMTKEAASAPTEPLQPRPTEKQLETIRDLGGTAPPGISPGQASELTDPLLAEAELRHTPQITAGANPIPEETFAAIQATNHGAGVPIQGEPEAPKELAIETVPAPAETEERFCKCPCGSCGVNIEFPAHGVGQTVSCPKCGYDVVLFDSSPAGPQPTGK